MSRLITSIDDEISNRSLLKHPFYRMWAEGRLPLDHLAGYSKDYFQLVKAVPNLVSNVSNSARDPRARHQIEENRKEELGHVEPWIKFAKALGVKNRELLGYHGARKTLESIAELDRLTSLSFQEGIAALYAYEKQLPEISRSKIDGLQAYYGIRGGEGTRYFELHEEADLRHAAVWRAMLMKSAKEDHGPILRAAIASLRAQNALLDSVMEEYCE